MTCRGKRLPILLWLLVLPAVIPASAQRGMNHFGGSRGGSIARTSNFHCSGYSTPFYGPSFYPTYFGGESYSPAPVYSPYMRGDGVVTYNAQPAPLVYDVYVPSYLRPSDGPSLAEVAASLKTTRKPAVLTWSNWPAGSAKLEPPLPPQAPAVRKQ